MTVSRVGDGVYRVDEDGHAEIVHVAGSADDSWAFWRGQVFRVTASAQPVERSARRRTDGTVQPLSSPMPATVSKVLVQTGQAVRKGETLVVLEAMKMELPLRALSDGTVSAVHCKEGDLVQPDTVLVELR